MITLLEPLPIGNAVRAFMSVPAGTVQWALLRKLTNDISGIADPGATVVYRGNQAQVVLDADPTLINGTTYFYEELDSVDGVTFTPSTALSVAPAYTALDVSADPQALVRQRLALALNNAVAAGSLALPAGAAIAVLTAPPVFEDTSWPLVTVQVKTDAPEVRGIGEQVSADIDDTIADDWVTSEGYLSRVQLQVVAWSLNPDERIALRKAVKAAIIGNFSVFDDAGMDLVDPHFTDMEDFESYNAPVYQSMCMLSFLAPSIVQSTVSDIIDVTETPTAFFNSTPFTVVEIP